eukprot:4945976-Prymnesium_polylepis.1
MAHPCTLLRAGRTWHHALFQSRRASHRSYRRYGTHPTPYGTHPTPSSQDVASDAYLDGHADGAIGIVPQHV